MLKFGEVLKELREKANLTQDALGHALNVSVSTIYNYEHNMRSPSPEMLIMIANKFHVSVDYLLGRERELRTLDLSDLDNKDLEFINKIINFLQSKNRVDDAAPNKRSRKEYDSEDADPHEDDPEEYDPEVN